MIVGDGRGVEAETRSCGGKSRNVFFCFLSPSLVPVENPNRDVKLLLVPVEPPEIKDWSLLSRQRSPGWKTGTKASF